MKKYKATYHIIFQRDYISYANSWFIRLVVFLQFLLIAIMQFTISYKPKTQTSDMKEKIRKRYYTYILTENSRMSSPITPHREKQNSQLALLEHGLVDSSRVPGMKFEIEILNAYQSILDSVGPAPILKNQSLSPDKLLEKILGKIRTENRQGPFDPQFDLSGTEAEKLILKRPDAVPTINQDRIANPLLETQANRSPRMVGEIIRLNESAVFHCYERFYRWRNPSRGAVEVEFKIDFKGHVIPSSVRIIQTDFKNPAFIRCIKKTIRHWKNFGIIASSPHHYRVTQKWVF